MIDLVPSVSYFRDYVPHVVLCVALVFLLSISVIYMKIKKGGKPPKDPHIVYGCGECGEYFTSPEILQQHCQDKHSITLSVSESKKRPYGITPDKHKLMLAHEAANSTTTEKAAGEAAERSTAKLSQDPSSDPSNLLHLSDVSDPDLLYKKLLSVLDSPLTSQPLPGMFKIDINGSKIRLIIALELQNTSTNMEAISTFNASIA